MEKTYCSRNTCDWVNKITGKCTVAGCMVPEEVRKRQKIADENDARAIRETIYRLRIVERKKRRGDWAKWI